jgi:PAS domain S-box-containing protein
MPEKPTYEELERRVLELERVLADPTIARDIPDGKAVEENEGKYRLMVENANEAILVAQDGVFVFSNPRGEALFGYSVDEFGSRPLTEFVHEADRRMVGDRHQARIAGDTSIPDVYDFRIIDKSGDIRWVTLKVAVFSWEKRPAALCFMTDVTTRKQAEEALQESEEIMRYIIKHDPNAIAVYDRNLHYIAVSDRYLQDYNVADRDILGKHHYAVFPEMPKRLKDVHQRVLQGAVERNDDDGFKRPDGSFTYNRWECRPWYRADGSIGGMITYTEVTTERKLAEQALKRSEERFRRIVETAEEGIWLVDRKWETELVNDRMAEMLGYQHEEILGRHLLSFMDEQEQSWARELMARREQGLNEKHDFKFQRRDGSDLWAIVSTNAVISEDGQFMHALAMVTDITERKQAEEALRESEKRYRMVVQDQTEVISRFLPDGTFSFVNQVYCDFFGKKEHELLGNRWTPVAHPDDVETIQSKLAEISPANPVVDIENRVYSGKGRLHWFRFINRGFFNNEGRLSEIQSVGRDITDRKRAEADLQKSMAEKVVLLREIHHRVKNNMQAIIGLLRVHSRRTTDAHLTEIFNDCRDRIGAMSVIHETLYQSENLAKIDFNAYLKKLCRSLAQAHDARRKRITLTTSAADVSLNMDQGVAVGMIVAELISNAFKHAFPDGEGGTVSVHLDRPDGETVRLVVSDTGVGLPEDFDIQNPPSLGMRLVAGAVTRELGGTLAVEGDGGTRFIIRFPHKDW